MDLRLLVSVVLFVAINEVLSQADIQDVPVEKVKPQPVIRYKLIRMSDEDIKREEQAKKIQKMKDDLHKEWHKKLFPCKDYSPICSRYKNLWNPGIAQCRDVFMQRNCRETCGLCNVPFGVFLGCNDMQHCKALGSNACVHRWVEETCKTMCGSCDGSKGRKNARVGSSSVFVGKKKSIVSAKVKTVEEAVKNQHKAIETKENLKIVKDEDEDTSGAEETVEDKATEKVAEKPKPIKDHPKKIKVVKPAVHITKIHHNKKHHKAHQKPKKPHYKHHHKKVSHDKNHKKNPIKAIIKKHKKHIKS